MAESEYDKLKQELKTENGGTGNGMPEDPKSPKAGSPAKSTTTPKSKREDPQEDPDKVIPIGSQQLRDIESSIDPHWEEEAARLQKDSEMAQKSAKEMDGVTYEEAIKRIMSHDDWADISKEVFEHAPPEINRSKYHWEELERGVAALLYQDGMGYLQLSPALKADLQLLMKFKGHRDYQMEIGPYYSPYGSP